MGSIVTNEYDANDAIWGSLQVPYTTDPNNKDLRYTRNRNGFFLDHNGIRHKGVSGVLITRLNFGNIHAPEFWLYKHPWAVHEMNFNTMALSYFQILENVIEKVDKKHISDILKLPQEWTIF